MNYLIIILIGIVQGVAEFLPISSSGHLVLLYNIFKITDNTIFLSLILHLATLFAIIFIYYKDILILIKNPFCKTNKLLILSTIPTVIIALIFESTISKFFNGDFIIIGFLITAIILLASNYIKSSNSFKSDILNLNLSYKDAFLIGVSQGFATLPGISRSGSTISTALFLKVNKEDATKFSFLLSIPIIIGSFIYELIKVDMVDFNFSVLQLFLGFLFAFIFGIISVKIMIKFVKEKKLKYFSFYLIILSIFLILNKFVIHLW